MIGTRTAVTATAAPHITIARPIVLNTEVSIAKNMSEKCEHALGSGPGRALEFCRCYLVPETVAAEHPGIRGRQAPWKPWPASTLATVATEHSRNRGRRAL